MAKLYQFHDAQNKVCSSFIQKLSAAVGELPPAVTDALAPLDRLPVEYHSRAIEFAKKSIRRHNEPHMLPERFRRTIEILDWLSQYDLHLRPTKRQVQSVAADTDTPAAEVAREVGRLAEMVGQELLVHCLNGNKKITALGRQNVKLSDQLTREGLYNTNQGISRKSLDGANARRDAARCADFRNRADGIAEFCHAQGMHGVKHYITAPACFHPGPHRGDVDWRWVAAGKPTPRDAANFLLGVLNATRTQAAAHGIVPVGIRTAECHESGVLHFNLPLWFHSKEQHAQFLSILRNAYATALATLPESCRAISPFGLDPQAIVYATIKPGIDEAKAATGYACKGIHASSHATAVLAADDRAWCNLWRIRQWATWGTPSTKSYKALARPCAKTCAMAQAGALPAPVAALVDAATQRDYAQWLRLTHPLSSRRAVIAGADTLVLVNHSLWSIATNKGTIFTPATASLQLCEAYPTRTERPPATPPPRPTADSSNAYLKASRG